MKAASTTASFHVHAGVLALATLALYGPLFPPLVHEWLEFPSLSHGFAIPLIAAYLVFARWHALQAITPAPSWLGLPVLLLGLAALVAGVLSTESFLARISLPVTLGGLVLLLAGSPLLGKTWYAIGYLFFMIPPPFAALKSVAYRSRMLDATASAEALKVLGVPVFQEGVLLHLPNITLEVADECSSIPALMAMIALGAAYAYLTQHGHARRAMLILASIPLAVTSNIIRIVFTAWGTYHVGPLVLESTIHRFSGTVNFLITFLFLILLERGMSRLSPERH